MFNTIKTVFTSPKGAKSRLVVTAAAAVLGAVMAVAATLSAEFSLRTILEFPVALASMIGIFGLSAWMIAKWISFMGRKPIEWAAAFWHSFLPLNLFTFLIKAYIWVIIIIASYLIPTSVIGGLIGLLVSGVASLAITNGLLGVLGLAVAGAGACALLYAAVKTDLRSLKARMA